MRAAAGQKTEELGMKRGRRGLVKLERRGRGPNCSAIVGNGRVRKSLTESMEESRSLTSKHLLLRGGARERH